jgi:hypothetical protein
VHLPKAYSPKCLEEEFSEVRLPPLLCDNVSYVEDHKPIDVYIRNIIPLGIRLPRWQSCALWAGAMLNFAITEFYEVQR